MLLHATICGSLACSYHCETKLCMGITLYLECGGLSNNEYDMLSNSSDKIMFFAHNATQRFPLR